MTSRGNIPRCSGIVSDKPKVLTAWDRNRTVLDCTGSPQRTKQSFRDECDINGIMAKYIKTGTVAHVAKHGGQYGFAPSGDYMDAMETVARAQSMFMDLPAKVREKFANDPAQFLAFVQDPKNEKDMAAMGLLQTPPTPPPATGTTAPPTPPTT